MPAIASTAILHYTAPPVIGGVEAVIEAHARQLLREGVPCAIVAGDGSASALPQGVRWVEIPELNSLHPQILAISGELEQGNVPGNFEPMAAAIQDRLEPLLANYPNLIVHNVFTKHFNLPLTAALVNLLEGGSIKNCLAWCHDFTWTSEHSRGSVHPGYPWDLLRQYRQDVTYVVVSEKRQQELAGLFGVAPEGIRVVYNGVAPDILLGISELGQKIIERFGLLYSDLNLLMPVRVTQAKNIEFALQVAAAIKKAGIKIRLVLTGPPDPHDERSMAYFQQLQAMRSDLGLDDEMHFVFELDGPRDSGTILNLDVVGELYRVCDAVFMPSHREGFGMPVLEAGLAGLAVFSTPVPASQEIGGAYVRIFPFDAVPQEVARLIVDWAQGDSTHQFRRKMRQKYTWQAIFENDIRPLLEMRA
jgi:glycosyltransferase involved in cell wall biosynthesis